MRLSLLFALIAVAACTNESNNSQWSKEEQTITVALRNDVRGFEPGVSRDVFTDDVFLHIYESLVTYDESGAVIPLLAESIGRSEDGKTYTFKLKDNVQFHNGDRLDASLVVANYQRLLGSDSRWLCRSWYDGSRGLEIKSVLIVDDLTLRMVINRPDVSFLDKLANIQCGGYVLHPDSFDQKGKFVEPIGTGPYRLRDWQRGEYILLEKVDAYHSYLGFENGLGGAKPAPTTFIKWQVVPDVSSSIAGLVSGQLDMAGRLDASNLFDLQNASAIKVHTVQSLDWNTLLVQTKNPVLSNKQLRLAIAHSIDLQAMAEVISHGISKPNPSVVGSSSTFYQSCHQHGYRFDLDYAQTLLSKSGYQGESIKLITNKRFTHMYDNALLLHAMLSELGLNVELEVLEWATQIDRYLSGDFQLMSFGFSGRTDPLLAYEAVLGDKQKFPYFQWDNAQARELLNRSMLQTDIDERKRIFCDIHSLMVEDVPMINLYNHYIIDATSSQLQGYSSYILQTPRFWGVSVMELRH